jgi:hypothetical protein
MCWIRTLLPIQSSDTVIFGNSFDADIAFLFRSVGVSRTSSLVSSKAVLASSWMVKAVRGTSARAHHQISEVWVVLRRIGLLEIGLK